MTIKRNLNTVRNAPTCTLDIETCKPGPENVWWQRHSYVKVNYALGVKALRGHRTERQNAGSRVRNSNQSHESLLWTSTSGTLNEILLSNSFTLT